MIYFEGYDKQQLDQLVAIIKAGIEVIGRNEIETFLYLDLCDWCLDQETDSEINNLE